MDSITRKYSFTISPARRCNSGLPPRCAASLFFLFGIVAGAVADRSGRKAQLIIAQVTNAILNVVLATLVLPDRVEPWHVYLTGFLVGTVQAFQSPARQTLISDIVGSKHLINALALNSMALNSSRAVGPAIAGLLIATVGVHGSYYVQAFMYIIATIWTMQMRIPRTPSASPPAWPTNRCGRALKRGSPT